MKGKRLVLIVSVLIGFIFLILPLLILSLLNQPSADDFCYAIEVKQLGFWKAQFQFYTGWSGRYFATFLMGLNPISFNWIGGYKILSILLITALISSLFFYINSFLHLASKLEVLALSILLFFVFIFKFPSLIEGIYWMAGALTYLVPNILLLLLLSSIFKFKSGSYRYFYLSLLLVVLISGSNETIMLLLLAILIGILIALWLVTQKVDIRIGILILVSIVSAIIVILAPGNSNRISNFPHSHQFVFSIVSSLKDVNHYFFKWLPMMLVVSLFIISSYYSQLTDKFISKEKYPLLYLNPLLVLLGIVLLLVAGFFPAYFSMGINPPHRTLNTIYFVMFLGWFYFMWVLTIYFSGKFNYISNSKIKYFLLILIFIMLITDKKNSYRIISDDLLSGKASDYNEKIVDRYELIKNSNKPLVEFKKIENPPVSIFFTELSTDSTDWKNQCMGEYFGKELTVE